MSLGLTNAKISLHTGGRPKVQKIKPARTSIAEDAKFIPKPHKRVSYEIKAGTVPTGISGNKRSGDQSIAAGGNLKPGEFGSHGVSATIGRVEMKVDITPEKDFTVIAPQEEGRQTNNASSTHYTQQYDAYGRPRIGFSREPYDFAATKYMAMTSEIKFQENMESTMETYKSNNQLLVNGQETQPGADPVNLFGQKAADENAKGMITATKPEDVKLPGEAGKVETTTIKPEDVAFPGKENQTEAGMVDPESARQVLGKQPPDGKQQEPQKPVEPEKSMGQTIVEVAKKLGIELQNIMSPDKFNEVAKAHDLSATSGTPVAVSVSA